MRLALLSDIRGNLAELETTLAYPAILLGLPVALLADGSAVLHHRVIGDGGELTRSVAGKTQCLPGLIRRDVRRRNG